MTSVILVFTITPWNILPTLFTENVIVIAVTDYGCVVESNMRHSVVVSDCKENIGDLVSATFYVPAIDQNEYYDRIQDKLEMIIFNLYFFITSSYFNPNILLGRLLFL